MTIQGLSSPAQSVLIDGKDSGVFTSTVGTGAGGNINILANTLTLQNGGTLSAATSGIAPSATGGTITVDANEVQVNSGGLITAATTGAGVGGSVNINAGNTFSSNAGTVSSTGVASERRQHQYHSRPNCHVDERRLRSRRAVQVLAMPVIFLLMRVHSWSCKTVRSRRRQRRPAEGISRSALWT